MLAKSEHIWNVTGVSIEEDFPPIIDSNRKILKPVLRAANRMKDQNGNRMFTASLRVNKLNVNGKTYTVIMMMKLFEEYHSHTFAKKI